MDEDQIIEKLYQIMKISQALKKEVSGMPALEGDVDRILAISREKLLLLDSENFMRYRSEEER